MSAIWGIVALRPGCSVPEHSAHLFESTYQKAVKSTAMKVSLLQTLFLAAAFNTSQRKPSRSSFRSETANAAFYLPPIAFWTIARN